MQRDEFFMRECIRVARDAASLGEWPFAAVIYSPLHAFQIGPHSSTERTTDDPLGHAEVNALRQASRWSEEDRRRATLYSTHEPCLMCAGMIAQLRIGRVVVGTLRSDLPRHFRQRSLSFEAILNDARYPVEVVTGVLRDEALSLFERVGVET